MKWKIPPKIKIYEALGTLADGRIEVYDDSAKVYSSSGNKFYTVTYDPNANAIMTNDNGSYWQGYLGYPAIAYLMSVGKIKFDKKYSTALKGIAWKDVNTKFKNDFEKTIVYVNELLASSDIEVEAFEKEIEEILKQIKKLNLSLLGQKNKPPVGY